MKEITEGDRESTTHFPFQHPVVWLFETKRPQNRLRIWSRRVSKIAPKHRSAAGNVRSNICETGLLFGEVCAFALVRQWFGGLLFGWRIRLFFLRSLCKPTVAV